jgi:hypothetical protein
MKDNQFSIKESQNSIWILNNFNVAIPDSLFEKVKPQKVIINNVNYKTKNSLIRNSEGLDFEIYDLKKQGMYVHQL